MWNNVQVTTLIDRCILYHILWPIAWWPIGQFNVQLPASACTAYIQWRAISRQFCDKSSFRSYRRLSAARRPSTTAASPTTCCAPGTWKAARTRAAPTRAVRWSVTSMIIGGCMASLASEAAVLSRTSPACTRASPSSSIGSSSTLDISVSLTSGKKWWKCTTDLNRPALPNSFYRYIPVYRNEVFAGK